MARDNFKCPFRGDCFAKGELGGCRILTTMPMTDKCAFQKPYSAVTNGKAYPYDQNYDGSDYKLKAPDRTADAWAVEWDYVTGKMLER